MKHNLAQTTRYAAVLAKMGAQRSQVLSESKLRTLTESKSLLELAGQLRETSYQPQISRASTPLTSRKLERAFIENQIETYIKIIKNSPKRTAHFLRVYLVRFEVENIKALIKAANAQLDFEQKIGKIYTAAEDYLKRRGIIDEAAKVADVTGTVNAFKDTEYALALKMGLQSYNEDGSTACFDVMLDKHFYENLLAAHEALPSRERPHANYYVSMEYVGFILLTLLRGKNLNYDPNWLRLAVPDKKLDITNETIEAIVTAPDFDLALKDVFETSYGRFFERKETPEETIANAERTFTKAVLQHAKESRFNEIFNVGSVLAFSAQKNAEVHNLIAVSLGVEAELKPEDVQRQLLL